MDARAPGVEDAHAIERRDAEFVFPRNSLGCTSNGGFKASTRCLSLVDTNIRKNVFRSADASGAFQNAHETGLARTVFAEDHCHASSKDDLRTWLERINTVSDLER